VNKELRLFQNKEGAFAKKLARSYQNFEYIPGIKTILFYSIKSICSVQLNKYVMFSSMI
jgi:hypothetical protein